MPAAVAPHSAAHNFLLHPVLPLKGQRRRDQPYVLSQRILRVAAGISKPSASVFGKISATERTNLRAGRRTAAGSSTLTGLDISAVAGTSLKVFRLPNIAPAERDSGRGGILLPQNWAAADMSKPVSLQS